MATSSHFDMPSQPQPGEDDERDVIYRDLADLTVEHEQLKAAARAVIGALADPYAGKLDAAVAALRAAL